jgi:hypothetical protein
MRAVLLKAPNVFSLDFANQEDRMSAWFANEEKDIQAFNENRKLHQEMGDALGVTYKQGT